ncbi:MAG: flagellar protein [Sideroxydans sp.]|nr:flagellar protein [Sideroxydans sp.]
MPIQNINNASPSPQTSGSQATPLPAPSSTGTAAAKVQPAQPAASQPSEAQVQQAVDTINNKLLQANKNLQFSIDQDSHKTVVKIVESKTGEVLKQLPSKEAIAISQSIDSMPKGLLVKHQA